MRKQRSIFDIAIPTVSIIKRKHKKWYEEIEGIVMVKEKKLFTEIQDSIGGKHKVQLVWIRKKENGNYEVSVQDKYKGYYIKEGRFDSLDNFVVKNDLYV